MVVCSAINDYNDGMASITIRNLDDSVKQRLRVRAAGKGRSLEAEVRDILSRSVQTHGEPHVKTALDLFKPIRDVVKKYGGVELDIPPRTPMRDVELGSAPHSVAGKRGKSALSNTSKGIRAFQKRGETLVSSLRKTHGGEFATGVRGDTKLESLLRDVAGDFRRESDERRPSRRKK